jgi:phosphoribosylanthranilate isomerase
MEPIVKICGINSLDALDAALAAGADMIGLVRFERSPRHLGLDQGRALAERARGKAQRVVLVVDADDAALAEVVAAFDPDLLQLHGSETPERVAAIRARFGRPVMKAVGIADAGDLARVAAYAGAADRLLLDAKPPPTVEALPGGNGLAFDWGLAAGLDVAKPVMLSGGLDSRNVAAAVGLTGVKAVDVSSGVERRPGEKDPDKIAAFVKAAREAFAAPQNKDKFA